MVKKRKGDGGFLYVDLIFSLVILSLVVTSLFSAVGRIRKSLSEEYQSYKEVIIRYEELIEKGISNDNPSF